MPLSHETEIIIPTSTVPRDLRNAGLALVPGLAITGVALTVNAAFVVSGWPLFVILGLGLFAGTLAALSTANSSKSS